jgi:hypothetical protein
VCCFCAAFTPGNPNLALNGHRGDENSSDPRQDLVSQIRTSGRHNCPSSTQYKSHNIARPGIQEVGSEASGTVIHTPKEVAYRQDEFMASDVNHLEAVDFSCTVETNPKEKPGVCEICIVANELFVVSLSRNENDCRAPR